MAECASLESYEGSLNDELPPGIAAASSATNFQFSNGIEANGILPNSDMFGSLSANWPGKNCTDPDYDHKDHCMFYPNPASPFAQIGDFLFTGKFGHVQQYRPNATAAPTASVKNPGLSELAVSWTAASDTTDYTSSPKAPNDGWDFFSVIQKDDDPNKAMILYLAGHNFGDSISGNRVVLNTLLNLGADPTGSERALVPPVAFNDPNDSIPKVLQGTYEAIADYPDGVQNFSPSTGPQWVFPYIPGHLRAHPLSGSNALQVGNNLLSSASIWDADDASLMPAPGDRNLFTYFGGTVQSGDQTTIDASFGSFGLTSTHPVFQLGWVPQRVSYDAMDLGNCVDKLAFQQTDPKDASTYGFVAVNGGDGICDIQEALELTPVSSTDELADIKANMKADLLDAKRMIQRVRGFCWATSGSTPIMEPSDKQQCDLGAISVAGGAINAAHLGGIVHSTPVVVGSGSLVGQNRPVVAYFGGYDGQLHAILVSSGSGFSPGSLHFPSGTVAASSVFKKHWAPASLSTLQPGTELWSYLPASQLPALSTNAARLDSAPAVSDVFGDFAGTGAREWHTVLVMSVGGTGREVFAMDVSNPLEPVLLWDLVGSIAPNSSKFSSNIPANKNLVDSSGNLKGSNSAPTRYSNKWQSGTTKYNYASTDPSDLFDYSDLGAASGVSIGQLRRGLDPVYVAFVTTNTANTSVSKGLEVFAIDIVSGQKLWQWERPYRGTEDSGTWSGTWADNAVPPVSTVFNLLADLPRLYTPDQEGLLWELDALTGRNVNYHDDLTNPIAGCSSSTPCELSLLNTSSSAADPQPLTTNVAVAQVPATVDAGSLFAKFTGAKLAIVGTGGADWVSSSTNGKLYVLLLDPSNRWPIESGGPSLDGSSILSQSQALAFAKSSGLLQAPSPSLPYVLGVGEHLYGAINVVGQRITFETASPRTLINDPMSLLKLSDSITGATYSLVIPSATTTVPPTLFGKGNLGGTATLVTSDAIYTIAAEVNDLAVTKEAVSTSVALPAASLNPDKSLQFQLLNWLRRKINP